MDEMDEMNNIKRMYELYMACREVPATEDIPIQAIIGDDTDAESAESTAQHSDHIKM